MGVSCRLDPGKQTTAESQALMDCGTEAFRNAPILLTSESEPDPNEVMEETETQETEK